MKILLINLPRDGEAQDHTTRDYLLTDFASYPPLGLLAIAADVNPKHSLQVVDTVVKNWTIDDTVRFITNYGPDLLGISAVTRRAYPMHEISRRTREALPDTRIVVGGPHATYFPEETLGLGTVDYVMHGYGERAFPLLVDAIEDGERFEELDKIGNLLFTLPDGRIHRTFDDPIPEVLDSLPFPKRQLIGLKDYYSAMDRAPMTTAYSARGCPFHCIYCDVQQKKFHFRSAKSLVDEFEEIKELGFKEIYLFDDTFNINRQRVLDICNEILKRRLKVSWSVRSRVFPFDSEMMRLLQQAGCKRLHVGIESLDPQILQYMKKKITLEQIRNFFALCREFKMDTVCYFIIGFPNETRKYRESLFDEVVKLGCTYAFVNILSPLAKTEYYHNLLEDGTFKEDFWAEFVKHPKPSFAVPHPRSPELQEELEAIADDFHRRFCLRPSFILQEVIRSAAYPKVFLLKVRLTIILLTVSLRKLGTAKSHMRKARVRELSESANRTILAEKGRTLARRISALQFLRGRLTLAMAASGVLLAISLLAVPLVNRSDHDSPQVLLAQATALWHMDETGGDRIFDAKGAHDATAYNTEIVEGPFGQARRFNGLNSYVKTALSFQGAPAVTISLWVRTDPRPQWAERGQQEGLHVIVDTGHDERSNFVVQSDAATYDIFSLYAAGPAVFELPRGIWTHLVIVVNPAERMRQVYIDGLKSNELVSAEVPTFGSIPLILGKWATQDARYFEGSLSEVAIWNRALSGDEIERLSDFYAAQARVKTVAYPSTATGTLTATPKRTPVPAPNSVRQPVLSGPKAVWHMNEPGGDVVADSTGAHNATASNTQVVDGPFGKARYFNGTNSYIMTPLSFRGASGVSISLWLKPDSAQSGDPATVFDTRHDAKSNFVFHSIDSAAMYFGWHSAETDLVFDLKPDIWTHLVLIADVSNGRLLAYQNGQLAGQVKTNSDVQLTSSTLIFGKWGSGDTRYFKGAISEVVAWERVLSEDEITALFANQQPIR